MTFTSPLTNFERFLLLEDQLAAPWHVYVRLQFDGQVDRTCATRAAEISLARHPLLASLVVPKGRSKLLWSAIPAERIEVKWETVPASDTYPDMPSLDLRKEIGFRVYESTAEGSSIVYFQFHHACVDGKGAMQFVGDWLIAYEQQCAGNSVPSAFPSIDESLLARRSTFGHGLWQRIAMVPHQAVGLLGAREFLMRRPQPILPDASPRRSSPDGRQDVAVLVRQFDANELESLAASAKNCGVTINDFLIRDVHLGLSRWRVAQDVVKHDEWLRMMVPINLRCDFERHMSAANAVGAVFIDRRGIDCRDKGALLQSVREQMGIIKRHRLGFVFLWSLWFQARLPGGLQSAVAGDACRYSTTLTNFGRVLDDLPLPYRDDFVTAGGLELQSVDVSGPLRPKNYAIFAVCTYARRLAISLRYDSQAIDKASAESLIEMVAQAIRDSADEGTVASAD